MPEKRISEGDKAARVQVEKPAAGPDVAALIADAFNEQFEAAPACIWCGGLGTRIGHDDACYDTGDCHCAGVQVQCECQDSNGAE